MFYPYLTWPKKSHCTAVDQCPVWLFCCRECSKPSYSCQKTGACYPPGRVSHRGSSAESRPSCWGEHIHHYCLLSSQFVTPYVLYCVFLYKMYIFSIWQSWHLVIFPISFTLCLHVIFKNNPVFFSLEKHIPCKMKSGQLRKTNQSLIIWICMIHKLFTSTSWWQISMLGMPTVHGDNI